MVRERIILLSAALVTIVAGLLVRGVLDGPLAKYLGIALYGCMMFWLVALIRPRAAAWSVTFVAVTICWGVEFLQLTPMPAAINKDMPLMRLVLGEHFSWWDVPTYGVGCIIAALLHLAMVRLSRPDPARP